MPSDDLSSPLLMGSNSTHFEKNNPQNAVMDCPFCQKTGYCGLSGVRTHIRNYCPRTENMIWRERLTLSLLLII